MTNKLLEETAAHTFIMSRSLIGKTLLEIAQEKGMFHTFCSTKKQPDTDASILFFISKGISFGCDFPADVDCKLVNIPFTPKKVERHRNCSNSRYKAHETAADSGYNLEFNAFIRTFFDTEVESYMLSSMNLSEFDSDGVNSFGMGRDSIARRRA